MVPCNARGLDGDVRFWEERGTLRSEIQREAVQTKVLDLGNVVGESEKL